MPEITSDQMRRAAARLREQWDQLEEAKTLLNVQRDALRTERKAINGRQNDLLQAAVALEYKAGEEERGGSLGKPSEAVNALIEGAIAAAESAPGAAEVDAQSAEVNAG